MYDVGMSALVANEAYCLAELADAIGKDPRTSRSLRARGDRLRDNIWRHLWDPSRSVFANRYRTVGSGTDASFVRAITPTSFYPLLLPLPEANSTFLGEHASKPSETVDSMVGAWLLNASRFCLSPDGDFTGNDPDNCYWGLPSVSADDPAYMADGLWNYWRGYVWGPMAQIVYWSLQERGATPRIPPRADDGSPVADEADFRQQRRITPLEPPSPLNVTRARKALCSQMEALMLSQWEKNRHICENYSPFRNATECTGTRFYHWGALNGLIGLIEAGYF